MNMGLPTPDQEMEILSRSEHGLVEATPVLSADDVVGMQELVKGVQAAVPVKQYIVNLLAATREHPALAVGVSPRGGVALLRAAQGWAAFEGRDFVVPADVKEIAPMVLSHRVLVDGGAGMPAGDAVLEILDSVAVPL